MTGLESLGIEAAILLVKAISDAVESAVAEGRDTVNVLSLAQAIALDDAARADLDRAIKEDE